MGLGSAEGASTVHDAVLACTEEGLMQGNM